jgi:hypothetical protein
MSTVKPFDGDVIVILGRIKYQNIYIYIDIDMYILLQSNIYVRTHVHILT